MCANAWFQVNLPRGCSINPSPLPEGFYQQPIEEIHKTLDIAVKPNLGALSGLPEHGSGDGEMEEYEEEHGAALTAADSCASILTPNCSITLADSGLESVMMMATSGAFADLSLDSTLDSR